MAIYFPFKISFYPQILFFFKKLLEINPTEFKEFRLNLLYYNIRKDLVEY
jgi:hypothetical protein